MVKGLNERELELVFDVWQENMINCCNVEFTFLQIENNTILVLLKGNKILK